MKEVLNKIWKFINSKFFGYAVSIVFILVIAIMCSSNQKLKNEIKKEIQNSGAITDTLKKEKLKNEQYQVTIDGFMASEKELKNINKSLSDEVKLQNGKVISLTKIIISLKQDTSQLNANIDYLNTIISKPIQLNDSVYLVPWTLAYNYDSLNYDKFSGQTIISLNAKKSKLKDIVINYNGKFKDIEVNHDTTSLIKRDSQIELVWGQKWENKKLRIFVNSSYPGFDVQSMQGVLLDMPKRRHWFTGFSVSVGITPTYDFFEKRPTILIGPSIGYTIYQW